MRISVIVTTYNRPDALKKVLDGLISQTRPPDEIVVADDGSRQETGNCLKPYLEQKNLQVRHVWQKDEGFRAAKIRNKAILASRGEYLIFLDGDCIPDSNFVADHDALAEGGCFFQGKRVLVNERFADTFNQQTVGSTFELIRLALCSGISNSHHIVRIPFFPSYRVKKISGIRSCNMGILKQDIVAVNGFNQSFKGWGREDTELVVRLFRYGLKRKENPFRAICYHLWHMENSRESLGVNDKLLADSNRGESYYCESGLVDLGNKEKSSTSNY